MDNSYFNAKLISLRKISLGIFTNKGINPTSKFVLVVNNKETKLNISKHVSDSNHQIFELELPYDFPFGNNVYLNIVDIASINIDLTKAINFPEFDVLFNYHGKLGPFYSKESTNFYLWSPLASGVTLKIENDNGSYDLYEMQRVNNGAYHIELKGDYNNKKYHYLVLNNGVLYETNDPYAKAVSLDSEYSVVLDISKISKRIKVDPANKIGKPSEAIIYELNVRDFTEDCESIDKKGKYLGLIEKGKTTKNNNPIGLDYLKDLGITHVQLLPVLDFYNKNDLSTCYYNWGYDPLSFFALEGGYSINPENPYSRIQEFTDVIDELHRNNIRVVMDVVYNHIYDYQSSSLEKTVPGYYFRKAKNGHMANASGCGNDFASEKFMARRMILESVKYLLETFDVDGFRFDLMGLIDIETINKVNKYIKGVKPDALIYGEGWNMGHELPFEQKSCLENAFKMPDIGFFNDAYRDIVKGGSFKANQHQRGYLSGDLSYVFGMDYAYHACSLPYSYNPKFANASQSINFVECHDNYTLFDKLLHSNSDEDEQTRLKRIELINSIILLSFGVPFIHMGQEIGLSKNDYGNTYNINKINNFNYNVYDERYNMVHSFKNAVKLRKELKILLTSEPYIIKDNVAVRHLESGLYIIDFINEQKMIILNPTLGNIIYDEKEIKVLYMDEFKENKEYVSKLNIDYLNLVICEYKGR